jgi:hypothetical protein
MPLAERVFYAYAKSLLFSVRQEDQEALRCLERFTAYTLAHQELMRYQFSRYYLADALLMMGDQEGAQEQAIGFVRRQHGKSWAWALLARASSEPEHRLACLCMAISLEQREAYLLKVRHLLTNVLLGKGEQKAAAQNLDIMVNVRKAHGWILPDEILTFLHADWYNTPSGDHTLDDIVERESKKALDLVFADLISECALVTGKNGKRYWLATESGIQVKLSTTLQLKVGNWVTIARSGKQILEHRHSGRPDDPGDRIRYFEGELIMKNGFGFVNDVFIPGQLLNKGSVDSGIHCRGTAVLDMDRKKNREGWKAISLETA